MGIYFFFQNYCCIDIFVLLHWHASFQIEASFTIHIVIASINNLNQSLNQTAIKSLTCARKCWNYITCKLLFKSVIVQIGPKSLWYTVDKIRKGCHLDCSQNKSCLNALAPLHWHANLWNEITFVIHASLNNLKPKMALTDNLSQNYPTFFPQIKYELGIGGNFRLHRATCQSLPSLILPFLHLSQPRPLQSNQGGFE